MSTSQAKATRQQIKKAFGPQALALITDLNNNLTDLRQGTSAFESNHAARLAALEADRARQKTLLSRLRWLLRG